MHWILTWVSVPVEILYSTSSWAGVHVWASVMHRPNYYKCRYDVDVAYASRYKRFRYHALSFFTSLKFFELSTHPGSRQYMAHKLLHLVYIHGFQGTSGPWTCCRTCSKLVSLGNDTTFQVRWQRWWSPCVIKHTSYLGISNGSAALFGCSYTLSLEHQHPNQFIPDVQERQAYC